MKRKYLILLDSISVDGGGSSPTPAPAPPADRSPAPPAAPPAEPAGGDDDGYDGLSRYTSEEPSIPGDGTTPKPPAGKDVTPPPEKPVVESGDQDDDGTPVEKIPMKDLRTRYKALKDKQRAAEAELKTLKSRPPEEPKELKERLTKLETDLKAREEKLQELNEQMKFVDYEKSAEYQEKYRRPYMEAWTSAVSAIAELMVEDADGNQRAATKDDFQRVMEARTNEDALRTAEEIFGSSSKANFAVSQRNEVLRHYAAALKAKEDFKKTMADREKQAKEQSEAQVREMHTYWTKLNTEAAEKFPQFFKPEEGDTQGNEKLTRGTALADFVFTNGQIEQDRIGALPKFVQEKIKAGQRLTPQDFARLHSVVRNKAAGFDKVAHKLNQAQARIKALESEVSKFRQSVPGNGQPGAGVDAGEDAEEAELRKYATET